MDRSMRGDKEYLTPLKNLIAVVSILEAYQGNRAPPLPTPFAQKNGEYGTVFVSCRKPPDYSLDIILQYSSPWSALSAR